MSMGVRVPVPSGGIRAGGFPPTAAVPVQPGGAVAGGATLPALVQSATGHVEQLAEELRSLPLADRRAIEAGAREAMLVLIGWLASKGLDLIEADVTAALFLLCLIAWVAARESR